MKGKISNFNRKKEIALSALLTEPTLQYVAKVAQISEVTLWRWLKEREFILKFNELKREAVGQALTRLQQISCNAVETLKDIMEDLNTPPSVRVSAAKSIIDLSVKAIEVNDIVKRIEDLEQIAKERA